MSEQKDTSSQPQDFSTVHRKIMRRDAMKAVGAAWFAVKRLLGTESHVAKANIGETVKNAKQFWHNSSGLQTGAEAALAEVVTIGAAAAALALNKTLHAKEDFANKFGFVISEFDEPNAKRLEDVLKALPTGFYHLEGLQLDLVLTNTDPTPISTEAKKAATSVRVQIRKDVFEASDKLALYEATRAICEHQMKLTSSNEKQAMLDGIASKMGFFGSQNFLKDILTHAKSVQSADDLKLEKLKSPQGLFLYDLKSSAENGTFTAEKIFALGAAIYTQGQKAFELSFVNLYPVNAENGAKIKGLYNFYKTQVYNGREYNVNAQNKESK